jgi:hypothetical protein
MRPSSFVVTVGSLSTSSASLKLASRSLTQGHVFPWSVDSATLMGPHRLARTLFTNTMATLPLGNDTACVYRPLLKCEFWERPLGS